MRDLERPKESLRGRVLLAHPGLLDPNFARSVVFLSEHSDTSGAVGVILNRPTGQRLQDLRPAYAETPLAEVPVFEGGPVEPNELLLAAWHWHPETGNLRMYFGASPEEMVTLSREDGFIVRAFAGYAGWSEGQLEGELKEKAWLIENMQPSCVADDPDRTLWRDLVRLKSPALGLLADAPDDPSVN